MQNKCLMEGLHVSHSMISHETCTCTRYCIPKALWWERQLHYYLRSVERYDGCALVFTIVWPLWGLSDAKIEHSWNYASRTKENSYCIIHVLPMKTWKSIQQRTMPFHLCLLSVAIEEKGGRSRKRRMALYCTCIVMSSERVGVWTVCNRVLSCLLITGIIFPNIIWLQ